MQSMIYINIFQYNRLLPSFWEPDSQRFHRGQVFQRYGLALRKSVQELLGNGASPSISYHIIGRCRILMDMISHDFRYIYIYVISYHIISYHIISFHFISYHIISYHTHTHTYIYIHIHVCMYIHTSMHIVAMLVFYEFSFTYFWCWDGLSDISPGFSGDDSLSAVLDPVPGAWSIVMPLVEIPSGNIAIENGPFIVNLPIEDGDFL